ncbi:LacI family DNA-binding transcriptional regulator [Aestuariivirga sp.]|uniref:LacI family DNA-binding transcriptional regulator n=1 Tax=Aestuariivirga sp. TaxID=2650926 RepID=UPI0039E2BA54
MARKAPARRITLEDVARLAKVSPITVSRALRTPESVSDGLRKRIDGAVMKLGYVPNAAASRLASNRSHSIGVIVPTLYNVIFAEYLQALHEIFLPAGFQVIVVNSRYSTEEEENAVRALLGQRVEAVIVVGVDHSPLARRLLQQSHVPVIETFQISPDPIGINIGLDHRRAGADATHCLIACGFRRVGFLLGQHDMRAVERLAGYREAMSDADLPADGLVMSIPQTSSITLGARIMSSFLAIGKPPEAVFCIDDNLALGAMQECRRVGMRVPDDISILGFHDLEFAAYASPSLSTVYTNRYEMGKRAAEVALGLIASNKRGNPDVINVGYRIVTRESTPA